MRTSSQSGQFSLTALIPLFKPGPVRIIRVQYNHLLGCFCSKSDRVPEMKTKVICGRNPVMGEGKTKTRINSGGGNRGVILSPAGRSGSLILVALQLIARKIRAKE